MELKIELGKKIVNGTEHHFLLTSSTAYEHVGDAYWELLDEEELLILISDVEKTIKGKWKEPLPVEFASGITTIIIFPEMSQIHWGNDDIKSIPTEKVLFLLNIWLNFVRFLKK